MRKRLRGGDAAWHDDLHYRPGDGNFRFHRGLRLRRPWPMQVT
ncbi:hypothetical protein ABN034_17135 [Actinopolymorpha sp. B11F2]